MPQPSTHFGEELRQRRLDAGLTLTTLSAAVHYSKAQLSKVERGIKAPSRDLARLCDAALEADGALIALVTAPPVGAPDAAATSGIDEEEWMMHLSPDGPSRFHPVSRRQVVSAGTASLMTWRAGGREPVSVAAAGGMLEASRSLFTHYRRLGQSVEPGFLHPAVRQLSARLSTSAHIFGRDRAFRASKSIAPGSAYPDALLTGLRRSSVLLAVIGPTEPA